MHQVKLSMTICVVVSSRTEQCIKYREWSSSQSVLRVRCSSRMLTLNIGVRRRLVCGFCAGWFQCAVDAAVGAGQLVVALSKDYVAAGDAGWSSSRRR